MRTNHLAGEKSPYLLQHVENPVDWYPWGEEAFEKARREGKPIFLSVGYSTCHWCHVMAHESFENEATAALLNEHFVSIKVDREERPDVDRVHMTFVQATTGSGGWPMSVWLTPDLKPFVGGTYFPPTDRYGRPGFPTVLLRIAEAWRNDREKVLAQGAQTLETLREYASPPGEAGPDLDASLLFRGFRQIADAFEPEHGGFSQAPKFPRPVTLNFLLRFAAADDGADARSAREMALFTLRKMADGGMHDHLGGGFHRYSVDRFWHIPHFEKMLYDQAQLALSYTEAFQITGETFFAETARDILDYVLRDMTAPEDGFYSAEDADSLFEPGKPEHGEGAFYLWRQEEIDAALDPDASRIFSAVYGVEPNGNAPEGSDPHGEFAGANTLIRRLTDEEAADTLSLSTESVRHSLRDSRALLLALRNHRPRPHRDEKIITAWNGLMISAFARAAQVLDEPCYCKAADRAAGFIWKNLYQQEHWTLLRNFCGGPASTGGFADDYAFLIQGLLDLYETDFNLAHLQWALELQETQNRLFACPEGGYFSTTDGDASILIRMRDDYDGAEPSPNSVSALNLLRLSEMTGRVDFRDRAEKTLRSFAAQLTRSPSAVPQMLVALDWLLHPPTHYVIAGKNGAQPLLDALRHPFIPGKVLLRIDSNDSQRWLGKRLPYLSGIAPVDGDAAVYRCENFTCSLPVSDPAELP